MKSGPQGARRAAGDAGRSGASPRSRSSSRCRSSSARRPRRSSRPSEAMQWLNAHHVHSPDHAARAGRPRVDRRRRPRVRHVRLRAARRRDRHRPATPSTTRSSVASPSHWDEATGDMICRAVVGWGGRGVRGDTDRIGAKLLAGILTNILASQYAPGHDRRSSDPCRPPGGAASSARTAGSPPPTSGRSTARSAACASCAADAARTIARCPSTTTTCANCRRRFEVVHGVHARGPTACPLCGGGPVRKAIIAPAVHFKGSGWAKKERRAPPRRRSKKDVDATSGKGSEEGAAATATAKADDRGDDERPTSGIRRSRLARPADSGGD